MAEPMRIAVARIVPAAQSVPPRMGILNGKNLYVTILLSEIRKFKLFLRTYCILNRCLICVGRRVYVCQKYRKKNREYNCKLFKDGIYNLFHTPNKDK